MLYSKILENSRCRECVSYTANVIVKCLDFKISNFISFLFMNPFYKIDSFEQVIKLFYLLFTVRVPFENN